VLNHWYIVCRSRDLQERPVAMSLFERHMVVFRAKNGKPAALEDRCLHRNAKLSEGRVCDGLITCPYHGWTYRGDGTLAQIPASCDDLGLQKSVLKTFPCIEQDGFIWVVPSEAPATESPLPFPFLNENGWTNFVMVTDFNAPVEACLENFLDCPHAAHVHKGWFRSPTREKVRAVVRTLDDGAVAEYFNEPRKKSVVWRLLSKSKSRMQHTDRFIAPATSRVDYIFSDRRHYTITSSCTPLSAEATRVYTVMNFKFGKIGWFIKLFFEPLSRLIIKQDVAMLNKQYANIRRFGRPKFQYTPEDLLGPHIVHWREALINNRKPPPAGQERCVDMRL
jgi:phenylpropionate dioxygenase-like ring-hydroxylating dioxygenase large terminal subunit